MITYKSLCSDDINKDLFRGFIRHQIVTKCWRKEKGDWIIKDVPYIDDWSDEDFDFLVKCLKNTVSIGGFVQAAFEDNILKGFVSVEPAVFGGEQKYNDLSSIHVSEDKRGKGIGRKLFCSAKDWAKKNGANKLYISGHPSIESQAFYKAMGCVEAQVYDKVHVEKDLFHCQLECQL